MSGGRFVLVCPEQTVEGEIAAGAKRQDVAETYALALRYCPGADFKRINTAILNRWSVSALRWIKERAWAYAEGRREWGK